MQNNCENCPHPDPLDECICEALENPWENFWHDLIQHDMREKLDLLGITESDLVNGVYTQK